MAAIAKLKKRLAELEVENEQLRAELAELKAKPAKATPAKTTAK